MIFMHRNPMLGLQQCPGPGSSYRRATWALRNSTFSVVTNRESPVRREAERDEDPQLDAAHGQLQCSQKLGLDWQAVLLSHIKAIPVKCLAPGPRGASLHSNPLTQPLTMQPPSTQCPQEAGSTEWKPIRDLACCETMRPWQSGSVLFGFL